MAEIELFDRSGQAVAYSPDGEHIHLWDGKPVAFLHEGKVYAFSGRFIGWLDDGWLRDQSGRCVLFTPEATGGPVKPVRKAKSVKGVRVVRPVKGVRAVPPVRPVSSLSWSSNSFEDLIRG
jgi:hypothetical protein